MKALIKSIIFTIAFSGTLLAQSITAVAPNNGLAGSQVTITGSGFSTTASENQVYFGKSKANVISVNSSGTELVVNTPTNPTFPSQISVLNTGTDKWVLSDVRFRFTYGARINPTTRNIQEQYLSESNPSNNLVSSLGRTSFGYSKGPILTTSDFNKDGATDIFLQIANQSSFNSQGTGDNGQHAFLENNNPTFSYTGNGAGFNAIKGSDLTDRLIETTQGIPYSEISQSGVISVDLNNDGVDEVIIFGSRNLNNYSPQTLTQHHRPAFSITEFVNDGSSNLITAESLTNKNIFTITADGGIDYNTDGGQSNPSMEVIENTGDQLLIQTSVLAMKASDIDGDGDMDLVALLSWPLLRFEQGASNVRPDRYQIYVFENTTAQGSNIFTFNSNTYNDGTVHSPASGIISGRTTNPPDGNFSGHLGNFLGPDYVISLNNSSFTGYNIDRWISDFELTDIDADGDFDIVVKGIENLAVATNTHVDTSQVNSSLNVAYKMEWFYDANIGTGLKAAASSNNGFLSWFENNSTTSGFSFASETVIDGSVPNNGKFDWGGIDVNDIDNDGDLDIIISTPDNSSTFTASPDVSIYLQTGSGTFATPVILDGPTSPTSTQNTQGFVVSNLMCEDLNGDGLLDIALTGSNMGELYTYMRLPNNSTISTSSFTLQAFNYSTSMGELLDMSLADYSNDGKPDLAIVVRSVGSTASSVKYFKNNTGEPSVLTSGQLGIFSKCLNNPSGAQEFTIGGINISKSNGHTVTATVTGDFEIALDTTSSYGASVSASPDNYNDVAATKVYIRSKSSSNDLAFQGTLTVSSNAAPPVEFDLNGKRRKPISGTITPSIQYVNTTNSPSPAPASSPSAVSLPGAITIAGYLGDIQWQKSSDNATWSDIPQATTSSYTLPFDDIEGDGLVYLRAKLTRCSEDAFSSVVTVIENLGAPAPPSLSPSNGQTIAGTFDESLTTTLSLTDASGSVIATCSDITNGCLGWTFYNGTFEYTQNPGLSDGTQVKAYATSNLTGTPKTSGFSSIITVDAVEPNAPVVNASNGNSISGTAEAGSTVSFSYSVGGSTITSSVVADASGNYKFYPTSPLADGIVVSVTSTDEVGNVSTISSVTVDATTPPLTINAIADGLTISGTTEGDATIVATDADGNTYSATADATGAFTIDISAGTHADGDVVSVISTDAAGNTSSIQTTTLDVTDPTANIYATDGTSFDGALDGTGYSVTISYGSGPTTQSATVTGSTFNWTPSQSLGLIAGDQITYTITDQFGRTTLYTTTVQSDVPCRPVHNTGIEVENIKFFADKNGISSVTIDSHVSDLFNDFTTASTNTQTIGYNDVPKIRVSPVNSLNPFQTQTLYYSVWIDSNQDNDFTTSELDKNGNVTLGPFIFDFDIEWSTAPFLNASDGDEYLMRIAISETQSAVSGPCGTANTTANYQDLRIRVSNCEQIIVTSLTDISTSSTNKIQVGFSYPTSSPDINYVLAQVPYPWMSPPWEADAFADDDGDFDVDAWLIDNSNASTTNRSGSNLTVSSSPNSGGTYDVTFDVTVDSKGLSLAQGQYYQVAIQNNGCNPLGPWRTNLYDVYNVKISDPTSPKYTSSLFSVESHSYAQSFDNNTGMPDGSLNLPIGEDLDIKTIVKNSTGSAAIPTNFAYFDVYAYLDYLDYDFDPLNPAPAPPPNFIVGKLSYAGSNPAVSSLSTSGTASNEVAHTISPTSATNYWLTFTFVNLPIDPPLDAMSAGLAKSVNVAWYEAPVLNSNGDGLTGAVPAETVTLVSNGVTYTAIAEADGTVSFTDFQDANGNALSGVNSAYSSIDQSWTSGGSSFTHANPTQVLSRLSINAATNSVTGTAAPGATVTLTIGDETFTTTADATTGIYDFAGTTSSTGVAFSTLVPFTATTAYSINQELSGYTSGAAVTGSILAAASDISVPTIGGALALSGSSTTVAGIAEAGSKVYLYDEDGNQLFDSNGDPITTTADDQGAYSITVDLSAAQISTGSNTFALAYTSTYTGSVIQVGSTDTDGNTAPLSAAFVNPSVYTSSGWTDASGTQISAPSTSGAATSSSPVIRYESNATLPSGTTGLSGIEVASGATVTVPTDGCLDVAGSLAVQGTGSISLGAAMNTGGTDVESAQLKFTGEYLGPPTLEMNGQLFKSAHTIGSPMKEGFVSSDLGDETKLIGWDAYTAGKYYSAGEAIATQGLGFYAIVGSNQFIAQAGGFDVIGSPMSSLDMTLGYAKDNHSVNSAGSGWNMIANPYTCGWDWSASTLTNVATTFYIYNVSNSSWTFWNSSTSTGTGLTSAVIPPLQGIWVQMLKSQNATVSSTMAAAGVLTCASGSSQNGFLKTANGIYKLTTIALGDSSDYSEMYLVDIAGATDGFDANYDAWHMNGHLGRGKLYNVVGAEEIVSNALEIDSSKIIDLAFDSDYLGTTYELNLTTSDVDSTLKVVLEDRYEGTLWSMDNGAYTFVHAEAPVGMKQTRFALRYYQEASNVVGEEELDEQANIAVAGTTITVSNPETYGEYHVYDASGRLMTKGAVTESISLPADNWVNGIYRLVFVGEQITTISIVVNK